jgi:hypothetical protein
MWVLFILIVVFPKEGGSNLKVSACIEQDEEFGKIPVPSISS